MKKYLKSLLCVLSIVLIGCVLGLVITGRSIGWGPFKALHTWQGDVDKIKEKYDTDRKGEIIFYGASNFALWKQLDMDLGEYKVQNHAFGGSTDKDLYQYADQILYPYQPRIVFLQTGSNDYVTMIGTDEEKIERCLEYKKRIFSAFHKELPDTKFVVMSGLLLPGRSEYINITLKINEKLAEYCEESEYLYFVNANNLTYDGKNLNEKLFRKDKIHLNHEGELIWYKDYIRPQLEEILNEFNMDDLRR